jgi:predicted ester cyclase
MIACDTDVAVVRRLMEQVWGEGRFELLPELIAPDYVAHLPIGDHYGPEGVRIDIAGYRARISDMTVSLEEVFAAGDLVVRRYVLRGTHRGATDAGLAQGRSVHLNGIAVDRVVLGRLVESWVVVAGVEAVWSPAMDAR